MVIFLTVWLTFGLAIWIANLFLDIKHLGLATCLFIGLPMCLTIGPAMIFYKGLFNK